MHCYTKKSLVCGGRVYTLSFLDHAILWRALQIIWRALAIIEQLWGHDRRSIEALRLSFFLFFEEFRLASHILFPVMERKKSQMKTLFYYLLPN